MREGDGIHILSSPTSSIWLMPMHTPLNHFAQWIFQTQIKYESMNTYKIVCVGLFFLFRFIWSSFGSECVFIHMFVGVFLAWDYISYHSFVYAFKSLYVGINKEFNSKSIYSYLIQHTTYSYLRVYDRKPFSTTTSRSSKSEIPLENWEFNKPDNGTVVISTITITITSITSMHNAVDAYAT